MKQCLIYDDSLRFSRATYGTLVLIAFLIKSQWLVLAVSLLMTLGVFSLKLNFPYQFHFLALRKLSKDTAGPVKKESGELNFVSGMTAALIFIGFLFLHFGKFIDFAWVYILIIDALIFLACFVGFCVATLMYVLVMKKIFKN